MPGPDDTFESRMLNNVGHTGISLKSDDPEPTHDSTMRLGDVSNPVTKKLHQAQDKIKSNTERLITKEPNDY